MHDESYTKEVTDMITGIAHNVVTVRDIAGHKNIPLIKQGDIIYFARSDLIRQRFALPPSPEGKA